MKRTLGALAAAAHAEPLQIADTGVHTQTIEAWLAADELYMASTLQKKEGDFDYPEGWSGYQTITLVDEAEDIDPEAPPFETIGWLNGVAWVYRPAADSKTL